MVVNGLYISLSMLFVIRLSAVVLFLMLYIRERKNAHLILFTGWLIYMAGPLTEIVTFSSAGTGTELNAFSPYSAALGTIFIMFGIMYYITKTRSNYFAGMTIAATMVLSIIFRLFPSSHGLVATLIQAVFLLFLLGLIIVYRDAFKSAQSNISFIWLCITLFWGLVHAIGFNLIYGELAISLKFVGTAVINISLIFFIIFLDWEAAHNKLEKSLEEKELLIQELHHRVKNNLMLISSIIALKKNSYNDPEKQELLQSIENRINSLSLVHKKLYEKNELADLSVNDYVSELLKSIAAAFESGSEPVEINSNIDNVRLSLDSLITIGMLINEIVTNAYKHAFSEIEKPVLDIEFRKTKKDYCVLTMQDNGKGFPGEYYENAAGSTGLMIINSLVKQLNAELEMTNKNGCVFTITIPSCR